MPELGFTCDRSDPGWEPSTRSDAIGRRNFSASPRIRTQTNGTRIAFWAETRREVDRIAKLVRKIGGKTLEGPELCKDYSPGYYAFFFENPDGNNLEICCREKPIIAK